MAWGEAWRLTQLLATDTTSQVGAACGGLLHPVSLEAAFIADLHDLTVQVNTDKKHQASVKPRPRPWVPKPRRWATPEVDQDTVVAALRDAGHTMPLAGH